MASKNSPLLFVAFNRSNKNSIAAMDSMECRSFLRIHIFCNSPFSVSISSRRVPERLMKMAG